MFPKIISVVAIGGNSSRLLPDKSMLDYHGIPQRQFLFNMLKEFTTDVYFSCNEIQSQSIDEKFRIIDSNKYAGQGPISGLLSAFDTHPDKSILFIGCDYVNIDYVSIQPLIDNRNGTGSVAYFNDENYYEPLLALYENSTYSDMKKYFEEGNYSLNKFLSNLNAIKIRPTNKNILLNINTVDQFQSFTAKDKII